MPDGSTRGAEAGAGSSGGSDRLVRYLGFFDAVYLVVGIIIGSGIFLTTGVMAEALPSPSGLLAAWVVGGALTLAGALTFSELGAAMPEAGGQYVYLREAYGPAVAFLFGWVTFLVYQPGAIAAVATAFAIYLGYFVPAVGQAATLEALGPLQVDATRITAAVLVLALTGVNVLGLRSGKRLQNLSTVAKIVAIVLFAVVGLATSTGDAGPQPPPPSGGLTLSGFGVALIGVLWAYDGWSNLSYSAGEIVDPARNLPRALLWGTLAVSGIYLLVNVLYLRTLSISEMAGVVGIGDRTAEALWGPRGGALVAGVVLVSTFSATNGSILTGARVYYAMARDGLFFRAVGRLHARHHTPHWSLWLQGGWASVLCLSGTFDALFTYAMFAAVVMYVGATTSVFTLRRRWPALPRPYRTWGYPVVPALYLAALLLLMGNTVVERPHEALAGLGIMALGLPAYLFWKSRLPADSPRAPRCPPARWRD